LAAGDYEILRLSSWRVFSAKGAIQLGAWGDAPEWMKTSV